MEDYKSQFVEIHSKLDKLLELLPNWLRSNEIEPPDLVVVPSAQVANDVSQVFDEMPILTLVDRNEESYANNVCMPSIDELVEGFDQQSPLNLDGLEVADNMFDELPSPPSIGLFEKYVQASDSGRKSDFCTDTEDVDQIILKEATSLLLDKFLVRVPVKSSYDVPHNVLENETLKMLDKITTFTLDINVLCLAERTELGICKGKNPIILADNDVLFYFDPGGVTLPQSFRTNRTNRPAIMNYEIPLGQNFLEGDAHMIFDEMNKLMKTNAMVVHKVGDSKIAMKNDTDRVVEGAPHPNSIDNQDSEVGGSTKPWYDEAKTVNKIVAGQCVIEDGAYKAFGEKTQAIRAVLLDDELTNHFAKYADFCKSVLFDPGGSIKCVMNSIREVAHLLFGKAQGKFIFGFKGIIESHRHANSSWTMHCPTSSCLKVTPTLFDLSTQLPTKHNIGFEGLGTWEPTIADFKFAVMEMVFGEIFVSMFDSGIGYWPLIGYDSISSHEMRNNSIVGLWNGNVLLCFDPGGNTFVRGTWSLRNTLSKSWDRLFDDTGVVANYLSSHDTSALKAINGFLMKKTHTEIFNRFDVFLEMLLDYWNFALPIPIFAHNVRHLCDLVMPLSLFIHKILWQVISTKDHDTSQVMSKVMALYMFCLKQGYLHEIICSAFSIVIKRIRRMYYDVCENEFPCCWNLGFSYDVLILILVVLSQSDILLYILEDKDCFEGVEKRILAMVMIRSIKDDQIDGMCGLNKACKPLRHLLFLSAFFTLRKLFSLYSIVAETGDELPTTKMVILDIVAGSYKLNFVGSSSVVGQGENATMIGARKSRKVMEPNFSILSRPGCNMCLGDLLGSEAVCGNFCEDLCVEAMDETIDNSLKLFVEVCDKQGNVQVMLMIWEVWYNTCTLSDCRCFLSMGELFHVPSTPNFNSHGNKNYLGMVEYMYILESNVSNVIPTWFGDTRSFCLVECSKDPVTVTTPMYFDEAWLLVRTGNYDMPRSLLDWPMTTFFWFEVSFMFDHLAIQMAQRLQLVEYDGYAENGEVQDDPALGMWLQLRNEDFGVWRLVFGADLWMMSSVVADCHLIKTMLEALFSKHSYGIMVFIFHPGERSNHLTTWNWINFTEWGVNFTEAAQSRHKPMNVYNFGASNHNQNRSASKSIYLWMSLFHLDATIMLKAIQSFQSSTLLYLAQQWIYPNGYDGVTIVKLETFVWDPGVCHFTTLWTRWLLRGRTCHDPRFKYDIICYRCHM